MTRIGATTIISRALAASQGCGPKLGAFNVFSLYRLPLSEHTEVTSRDIRAEPRLCTFGF